MKTLARCFFASYLLGLTGLLIECEVLNQDQAAVPSGGPLGWAALSCFYGATLVMVAGLGVASLRMARHAARHASVNQAR